MDLESYIRGWKERGGRENQALDALQAKALKSAKKMAQILRQEFGVGQVYLIGSVATGQMHSGSDIDLAVVGLDPVDYWKAIARIDQETDLAVDLIDLDIAVPSMLERVKKEGVSLLVHEK